MQQQEDRAPKIRVVVRKRPMSRKEESRGEDDIIEIRDQCTVVVREQK